MSTILFFAGCSKDKENDPEPEELVAKIDVSAISFISDTRAIDGQRIKAGQSVAFKDASSGGADAWLWEFEGLASSSVENPTVAWPDEVGQIKITLTVTRSSDGKTATDEMELQVGPVNLYAENIYGFENDEALLKWDTWSSTSTAVDGSWAGDNRATLSIDHSQGANGSSSSAKISRNYSMNVGETAWLQLSTWKNNAGNNAVMKSSTTYVFSYYMKADQPTTIESTNLLNRGGLSGEEQNWKDFGAWQNDIQIGAQWIKKEFEFTTDDLSQYATYEEGTANNVAPFFQVNPFDNKTGLVIIWLDEVSLKEKEQN